MLLSRMNSWSRPWLALVVVLGLALAVPGPARAATGTFRNPIGTGPDPTMTYFNGAYYLAMTEGDAIRIRRAPSVAGLLTATAVQVWKDSDPSRNQHLWAPELFHSGGRWYLYYTADDGVDENHRLYVLESDGDDPLGPYHFKARLFPPNRDVFAIDPGIMQHNGRLYLTWSGRNEFQHNGINLAPMSDPWTVSGNAVSINAAGHCPEVREGPAFLYRGGRTWMTYSVCDTGKPDYGIWMMSVASGADPLSRANWTQHDGNQFARQDARGVFGPGHHGFFTSPDGTETWIVYHAKTTSELTYTNRTTRIQRISFEADGTPDLGAPLAIGATQDLPSGDPGPSPSWINDTTVRYTGAWNADTGCGGQCFFGDQHWSDQTGATATYTFTGTQIVLLSARGPGSGIAGISLDNGAERRVDLYGAIRVGEVVNYRSGRLTYGTHTLRVRVTGAKNAAATGTRISIDRAEVSGS
uniref:glycoside hydrolase family 43 protein n=1 Tax=Paractinoplanes polyasparticus TaxID=2856853 RepID=UPI001C861A90|nr:glycoside hydrolase family 43 protein [Actinoplanes polyasparticus]